MNPGLRERFLVLLQSKGCSLHITPGSGVIMVMRAGAAISRSPFFETAIVEALSAILETAP